MLIWIKAAFNRLDQVAAQRNLEQGTALDAVDRPAYLGHDHPAEALPVWRGVIVHLILPCEHW